MIKTLISSPVIQTLFGFLPKSVYPENCNCWIPNKCFCLLNWFLFFKLRVWAEMMIVLDILFFPSIGVQHAIGYNGMELRKEIRTKAKDRG